jgi:hypothetical protein
MAVAQCVVCKASLHAVPEAPRLGYCPICRLEFLVDEDAELLPCQNNAPCRTESSGSPQPEEPVPFDPTQTRAYRMAARKLLQLPRYDKPLIRDPNRRRKRVLWRVFLICLAVHLVLLALVVGDVSSVGGKFRAMLGFTALGIVVSGLCTFIYFAVVYPIEWGRPDAALAHEAEPEPAAEVERAPLPDDPPEARTRSTASDTGPPPQTGITGDRERTGPPVSTSPVSDLTASRPADPPHFPGPPS